MIQQKNLVFLNHLDAPGREQRMTLLEFRQWIQHYIAVIFDTQQALNETYRAFHSIQQGSSNFITNATELGEYFDGFRSKIEFSQSLPLTVVPLLLPLTILLRKANRQVSHVKHLLICIPLPFPVSQEYQEIQRELLELERLCEEMVVQTNQLLDHVQLQELDGEGFNNVWTSQTHSSRLHIKNTASSKVIYLADFLHPIS